MNTPDFLPALVAANYQILVSRGDLTEREQSFFTDARLKKFWDRAGNYLHSLEHPEYLATAAECIPGVFLAPLYFYGHKVGTTERPTPKVKARERQKNSDPLINKAAKLAGELAETLESIEATTHIHPCELRLMAIVRKLVHDKNIARVASYYDGVRTSEALREIETALLAYPETSSIFDDVPGMASQKSTWVDWLAEAKENHRLLLRQHPGEFDLAEVDWVNLTKVLIDDGISRESVQSALRGLADG